MRRPSPRSGPARVGAAGFALALLLLAPPARGQAPAGPSLARYVPRNDLVVYLEYDGLDAHADAWRKTAAYKILNDTPTGGMLEDLFVQLVGKLPGARITGPEALAMVKHVARSGFVFAVGGDLKKDKPDFLVLAFRDAFKNKAVAPVFARNLQSMTAPNAKAQAVIRAGHKVVSGPVAGGGTYSWWVEESKKEDLVLVLPSPESADIILETLDGKRPNAVDHPGRAELAKPEGGFVPAGRAFLDPVVFRSPTIPAALGLSEITRLDYRWGFQGDALMTVGRVSSPSPRKGLLGLIDGPTFEKGKLPPLPDSLTGYSVTAVDLKTTLDKLVGLAKMSVPDAEDRVNQAVEAIKAKTKLRLREDILSHLGPRVAWYVLPGKAAQAPAAAPNMVGMMMAGAGVDQIPRLAIVLDVDDPVAFGKVLDELMGYANRELKAQAARAAGGEAAPARGARPRGPTPPSFEFKLGPGENKTYVLTAPPEMANLVTPSLRPTIRVGPKQVVIAVSADVARLALEAKGTWAPPAELAAAFGALPGKLKFLEVSDPRPTTPPILASLPAKLQAAINLSLLKPQPPTPTPPAGAPTAPGPAGAPVAEQALSVGGGVAPGAPGAPAANQPPGPAQPVVLRVDAARMPSADAIRGLLFPSVTTAEVSDEGLRIAVRQPFPPVPDPAQVGLFLQGFNAARARARMPAGSVPAGATPVPPPAATAAPPRPTEPAKAAGPRGAGRILRPER